jgi:hypothetical protein
VIPVVVGDEEDLAQVGLAGAVRNQRGLLVLIGGWAVSYAIVHILGYLIAIAIGQASVFRIESCSSTSITMKATPATGTSTGSQPKNRLPAN